MPKVLETFEFPHGGRKGLDYDFDSLLDGQIYQLERGVDFDMATTADAFLGALSRYANGKNLRVNKHVSEDKNTVTIRVRPKKERKPKPEGNANKPRGRNKTAAAA